MLSMTGFGRGIAQAQGRTVQVEMKSVNHRFLDLSFRLPKSLQAMEQAVRAQVSAALSRGHVDISVSYVLNAADARRVQVDLPLLQAYHQALSEAKQAVPMEDALRLSDLLAMPDVLSVTQQDDEQAAAALMEQAVAAALAQLLEARRLEGDAMQRDLVSHLATLRRLHQDMTVQAAAQPALARERLSTRLQEARLEGIDPQRLAQEAALLCDRSAVDEELVRLAAHLDQLEELLGAEGPQGRKLDFLAQEMNRETNTIGSKSILIDLTRSVLEMKNVLEKLREQIQNIE